MLMVASEATPFVKTGGLADVIGALPFALKHLGLEVAVVVPGYRAIRFPGAVREVWRGVRIPLGPGYTCDFYEAVERGVPFYFVDCPELYDREGIYGASGSDYPDNHLRFAVFSMAALEVARHLFRPDILHCHDWQAALTPVYLREYFQGDPTFVNIRTLFTIHNLGYQGLFTAAVLPEIGLGPKFFTPETLEFYGKVNLLKGGIVFSDRVSTVSKGYAREIQTPEYGFGLEGLLRARAGRLAGIVNGVDYTEWSPETDPYIAAKYSADDLAGKAECKQALLAEFGLPADTDRPVIGIVSRFVDQKGFDLIAGIAPVLLDLNVCLTVLGSGEERYESLFRGLASDRPDKIGVRIGYDNPLAHRIEAGADMFLMPSRYEPCGLNQIYSLRYGTIPIVRATGGLDDTIDESTGFKFKDYSGFALLEAIRQARMAYSDSQAWVARMRRAMSKDYSWSSSAVEYADLYREIG